MAELRKVGNKLLALQLIIIPYFRTFRISFLNSLWHSLSFSRIIIAFWF